MAVYVDRRRWLVAITIIAAVVLVWLLSSTEWLLKSFSSSTMLRILVSGGIAGFMEVSLMYPFENIKTQLQLQDPMYPKFEGMIDCFQKTVKTYGCVGLYGGLTPLLVSSVPSHSMRWWAYENVCHWLDNDQGCDVSVLNVFVSGLLSGALVALLIGVPAECIKTHLIEEGERLVPIEGWWNLLLHSYHGVIPTVAKKVINQGSRFPLYHIMFHALTDATAKPVDFPIRGFISGVFAGCFSVLITQPVDVVKTKMQGIHADRYQSSFQCLCHLYAQQGMKALYAGAAPRLFRVSIGAGITFTAYPWVKKFLQV